LSTAVAGAGVVQRYLVQIIVESAFSESKSVREDFCIHSSIIYAVRGYISQSTACLAQIHQWDLSA